MWRFHFNQHMSRKAFQIVSNLYLLKLTPVLQDIWIGKLLSRLRKFLQIPVYISYCSYVTEALITSSQHSLNKNKIPVFLLSLNIWNRKKKKFCEVLNRKNKLAVHSLVLKNSGNSLYVDLVRTLQEWTCVTGCILEYSNIKKGLCLILCLGQ